MNKNFLKNKNASISGTLTWVIASFIIFFIIVFYIWAVGLMAAKQKILFYEQKIEITKMQDDSSLSSTIFLINILNKNAVINGNEKPIKEHIIDWSKISDKDEKEKYQKQIQDYIKAELDDLNLESGYFLYLVYTDSFKKSEVVFLDNSFIIPGSGKNYFGVMSDNFINFKDNNKLERSYKIYLISDKIIEAGFYAGNVEFSSGGALIQNGL
jgi:hypothetical protein